MVLVNLALIRTAVVPSIIKSSTAVFHKSCHSILGALQTPTLTISTLWNSSSTSAHIIICCSS